MRSPIVVLALAGAALALVSGSANAFPCYRILDRTDHVVYQDTKPPVDMSDAGANERAALRARGGYLMITDTDDCFELVFDTLMLSDARPRTVDEIVASYRQFATSGGVSRAGTRSSGPAASAPASSFGAMQKSRY